MQMTRLTAVLLLFASQVLPAQAANQVARGKIIETGGHTSPDCRTVRLKRSTDSQILVFRISGTNQDDGILAATLTALTTGLDVEIVYDTALTSGCGTEPKILYIKLFAPGH